MDLIDYLPAIVILIFIVAIVVAGISIAKERQREKRGVSACIYCKADAPRFSQHTYLFLLPVFFGATYDDAQNYLLSHMKPIGVAEQIPTGMRACYVAVFLCPRCDKKHVMVRDFLRVRGEDHIQRIYRFPYEPFRPLLDGWDMTINQL